MKSGTTFVIRAFWLMIFLSLIFSKSNQKYFQGSVSRLVTPDFTFQSNGAQVPPNRWEHCGWRELAQIPEAAVSLGLLISLLAHQFTGPK